MFRLKISIGLAVLLSLSGPLAASADNVNLLQNGDFGTGDLLGWSIDTNVQYPWTVEGGKGGYYDVQTGCIGAACLTYGASTANYLSQTVATIPGDRYQLSFSEIVSANPFNAPQELDVYWGGALVQNTAANLGFTGILATGSSTTLSILGRDDAGYIDLTNLRLIDVGTAPPAPVPLPASVWLLLSGLGGLGLMGRNRKISKIVDRISETSSANAIVPIDA